MNSITKERAKSKAQNLKSYLKELGYDVKISHSYEIVAKQHGYESWNAMSAGLEAEYIPASYGNDTPTLEPLPDGCGIAERMLNRGIGEGENLYEFGVMANAKVLKYFEVRGTHPGHAYSNLEKFIDENEAEFFDGDGWEVEGNIGITEYWDINLRHSSGLHKERNIAPTTICSWGGGEEIEIQNEYGISWQSVQRES